MTLKLAAPWTVFYRQVQALFKDDPEVKQVMKEMEALEERLFKIVMKKKFNVDAGFLPNDEEHIVIDGVILNDEEFIDWLVDHDAIALDEEDIAKA